MVKSLYVVHDHKGGFNSPISMYDNDALAIRDFSNGAKDPRSILHSYPEDFDLVRIGTFNTENCELISFADFVVVSKATSFSDVRNEVLEDEVSNTVQS